MCTIPRTFFDTVKAQMPRADLQDDHRRLRQFLSVAVKQHHHYQSDSSASSIVHPAHRVHDACRCPPTCQPHPPRAVSRRRLCLRGEVGGGAAFLVLPRSCPLLSRIHPPGRHHFLTPPTYLTLKTSFRLSPWSCPKSRFRTHTHTHIHAHHAGRDAVAGGTWLGVNRCGKFGTVTNIPSVWAEILNQARSRVRPLTLASSTTVVGAAAAMAAFQRRQDGGGDGGQGWTVSSLGLLCAGLLTSSLGILVAVTSAARRSRGMLVANFLRSGEDAQQYCARLSKVNIKTEVKQGAIALFLEAREVLLTYRTCYCSVLLLPLWMEMITEFCSYTHCFVFCVFFTVGSFPAEGGLKGIEI